MSVIRDNVHRRRLRLIAALVVSMASGRALALDCDTLPNRVIGIGGSAQKPIVARVATALANASTPVSVIYQAPGACNGINALIGDTALSGTASYWTAAGVETQCNLTAGTKASWALMGNSALLCAGVSSLPANIGDFEGPVSTVNFVVPIGSSQQSISAEAAYFVYGFGRTGGASPWTDETAIIKRDDKSFLTLYLSTALRIPPAAFKGVDAKTNQNTVTLVAGAPTADVGIGYLSGDVADQNRTNNTIKTLAYQHFGQSCGYWPDSSPGTFDKLNVRNGQYYLWGPMHFFAFIDPTSKQITDQATRDFVGLFTGATQPPAGVDLLDLTIKSGNVPKCAMNAWRTGDLGPLMSLQPDEPCGCAFDKLATGATTCTPCTTSSECPGSRPVCRHNYCEVR